MILDLWSLSGDKSKIMTGAFVELPPNGVCDLTPNVISIRYHISGVFDRLEER